MTVKVTVAEPDLIIRSRSRGDRDDFLPALVSSVSLRRARVRQVCHEVNTYKPAASITVGRLHPVDRHRCERRRTLTIAMTVQKEQTAMVGVNQSSSEQPTTVHIESSEKVIDMENFNKDESDAVASKLEMNLSWEQVTQTVAILAEDGRQEEKALTRPPWPFFVRTLVFLTFNVRRQTLVDNVSGSAQPGKLTVIMGPSGAGKTTLLNCLANRTTATKGQVLVNGEPWRQSLTKLSAYVEQESLMFPLLTIEEYLTVSAYLRIKEPLTDEQRAQRVETVMQDLDLTKNRDTLIGGAAARITGLSGGEMKRTQFAAEVLTNPSIIFCDEPTSGLDSFMAAAIVKHLRTMSTEGGFRRTVVATIHQPSSQVFGLFDELIVMAQGRVAFSASAAEAVTHFDSLGFPVPPNYNPADHLMEILSVLPRSFFFSFFFTFQRHVTTRVRMLTVHWNSRSSLTSRRSPVPRSPPSATAGIRRRLLPIWPQRRPTPSCGHHSTRRRRKPWMTMISITVHSGPSAALSSYER